MSISEIFTHCVLYCIGQGMFHSEQKTLHISILSIFFLMTEKVITLYFTFSYKKQPKCCCYHTGMRLKYLQTMVMRKNSDLCGVPVNPVIYSRT